VDVGVDEGSKSNGNKLKIYASLKDWHRGFDDNQEKLSVIQIRYRQLREG
jgi:hypothetical protein